MKIVHRKYSQSNIYLEKYCWSALGVLSKYFVVQLEYCQNTIFPESGQAPDGPWPGAAGLGWALTKLSKLSPTALQKLSHWFQALQKLSKALKKLSQSFPKALQQLTQKLPALQKLSKSFPKAF